MKQGTEMKIWISLLLLAVVLVAAAFAAPPEGSSSSVELQTAPVSAMRVRVGGARFSSLAAGGGGGGEGSRAGCTNSGCYALCLLLGWTGGYCLDADWCLCYTM